MTIPSAEPTVSRRLLAKGAAWAVPAAAVVVAAPAFAESSNAANPQVSRSGACTAELSWTGSATEGYVVAYQTQSQVATNTWTELGTITGTTAQVLQTAPASPVVKVRVRNPPITDWVESSLLPVYPTLTTTTRTQAGPNEYDYVVAWNAINGASNYVVSGNSSTSTTEPTTGWVQHYSGTGLSAEWTTKGSSAVERWVRVTATICGTQFATTTKAWA